MTTRRTFLFSLAAIVPIFGAAALAQGNGKHKGHDDDDDDHDHGHGHDHEQAERRYFRDQDHAIVERYYSGPRNLPPGLQKKYARTGTLPPGWEKRYRPFPPALVAQLPPPPPNCERGFIDGNAVVFDRTSHTIVDSININIAFGH